MTSQEIATNKILSQGFLSKVSFLSKVRFSKCRATVQAKMQIDSGFAAKLDPFAWRSRITGTLNMNEFRQNHSQPYDYVDGRSLSL